MQSPIGYLPAKGSLDTSGVDVDAASMAELLQISPDDWRSEADNIGEFFGKFGNRLPPQMEEQRQALIKRLQDMRS